MKLINLLRNTFNNSKLVETKIQNEFFNNTYKEKVVLKNSIKINLQMLLGSIILVILTIYINTLHPNTMYSVIFCLIIVIIPLTKIINQKPKLIISKENLILGNGKEVKWVEIESTSIEELDSTDINSYYKLNILLKNNKIIKIGLSDLNYSESEISHIIEYYKQKNIC